MMVAENRNVNPRNTMACRWKRLGREKKPGPREPGL